MTCVCGHGSYIHYGDGKCLRSDCKCEKFQDVAPPPEDDKPKIRVLDINVPEPPPKKNDGVAIWDLVIADMRERNRFGIEQYGTPLQAFNGRNALIDAYQEALDLVVYLRQKIEEDKAK